MIREIIYFHPTGLSLPNGSHIQRGGFLNQCRQNRNAYTLDEAVYGVQHHLARSRGGVVTFPADAVAAQMGPEVFADEIGQGVESFNLYGKEKVIRIFRLFNNGVEESVGAYSIGNFFHGRFVGDNGEVYDARSVSVEVNGLGSRSLLRFADFIAKRFRQESLLVKDLNTEKIFLVSLAQKKIRPQWQPLASPRVHQGKKKKDY